MKIVYQIILASILTGSVATATTIGLTGIIRDFKGANEQGGHPDFETVLRGLQAGAVGGSLPGVNLASNRTITLSDIGTPATYCHTNMNFFPIDNQLFGNTAGTRHNYHFTYDIHSILTDYGGETLTSGSSSTTRWPSTSARTLLYPLPFLVLSCGIRLQAVSKRRKRAI